MEMSYYDRLPKRIRDLLKVAPFPAHEVYEHYDWCRDTNEVVNTIREHARAQGIPLHSR